MEVNLNKKETWVYAAHVVEVKKAGGPDAYVTKLKESAIQEYLNKKEMLNQVNKARNFRISTNVMNVAFMATNLCNIGIMVNNMIIRHKVKRETNKRKNLENGRLIIS